MNVMIDTPIIPSYIPPIPQVFPARQRVCPTSPIRIKIILRANLFSKDYAWAALIFYIIFVDGMGMKIISEAKTKSSAWWEGEVKRDGKLVTWKLEWRLPVESNARGCKGELAVIKKSDEIDSTLIDFIRANHKEVKIL